MNKAKSADMLQYEIVDGPGVTDCNLNAFVKLVSQGGAVDEHYVRQGLRREGSMAVFAKMDGKTVGVAALKVPSDGYRESLGGNSKSGYSIPQKKYPFELGYVAVSTENGGQGIAKSLVDQILALAKGKGIFATTGNPAMKRSILPRSGCSTVGKSWKNARHEELQLMIIEKT